MMFPSGLVPSLHVLVFGKKTFLYLVLVIFVCDISIQCNCIQGGEGVVAVCWVKVGGCFVLPIRDS